MKRNIVVLGGGFGGLRVVLSLAHSLQHAGLLDRYAVILVDQRDHHVYTPLLYEAAVPPSDPSRAISEDRMVLPFSKLLHGRPVYFAAGEVAELDLVNGDIHLAHGEELRCDYLVLAPGSEINYFGIPGLEKNSLALKSAADADRIRGALSDLLRANPAARILVGGGGPTGVEVAAEIKYNFPRAQVAIAEAMPTVLNGMSPRFLGVVMQRLSQLGVEMVTGEAIASVSKNAATTKNKRKLEFDLLIWTGGVKAPDFLKALPLRTEPRGRVEVAADMFCLPLKPDLKLAPMVYALGDSVCIYNPKTGKPVPGVAPTAIEQGEVVAANIFEDILEAEDHKRRHRRIYKYKERPYALSVGGRWTAAKIGPFVLTGFLAWAFERAVELDYRLSIKL